MQHGAWIAAREPCAQRNWRSNRDGFADILRTQAAGISILTDLGNGTFNSQVDYATANGPNKIVVADVNGDGSPDIAVTNGTASSVSILMRQANGTFAPAVNYATGASPYGLALDDVNGDNVRDLIVHSSSGVQVRLNLGNGTFGPTTTFPIGYAAAILSRWGNVLFRECGPADVRCGLQWRWEPRFGVRNGRRAVRAPQYVFAMN